MSTLLRALSSRCLSKRPLRIHTRHLASEHGLKHGLKPTKFGQPLFASHPHLMNPNETTPGIPADEYERRRKALMDELPDGSVVVVVSGQVKYMSGQIFYKFRQASDFWYLTGFEEPDSAVILEKNSSSRGYRMLMFTLGKDSHREKWDGARTSPQDVLQHFKADDAYSIAAFPTVLKSVLSKCTSVLVDLPPTASLSRRGRSSTYQGLLKDLSPIARTTRVEYDTIMDSLSSKMRQPLAPKLAKIRAVKSEPEQQLMRCAADISAHAHTKTMRFTEPDMSEHAVAAHFEYLCARDGSQRPAYVPVVASGPNALIIHYTSNNQVIRKDEMILIDAGCEYNGYASDITRTFPARGTFSSAQAALYDAVLQAQKYLVTLCTESAGLSLAHIHRESVYELRKRLNKIGFNLQGPSGMSDLEHELYPHYIGHPVGIDLHESAHLDRNAPLKAGMVVTIEPGIYVPPSPIFPKEFHNIGIRIEDEILVGKDHPTVLSVAAPKEIADVEGACRGTLGLEPY
ncbi:peptidase M24 [Phanerochaete sordida]|uniref:Peptidase M24 n=1 Tax=Phanerochaete sordida TaxID=48140 RepID=A0A9P3FZ66_9APHY|nr:peptidase M24 [Phanerochaete sordida]